MDKKPASTSALSRVWQVEVPFTLDGRYLLDAVIGTTPLGAAYRGRDLHQTQRAIEIVLFHPALFADKRRAAANQERLERAVTYVHPHVAPTWATGESDGATWVVTAPSAGQPLTIWRRDAQIIKRDIYRVLGQILSAMETIHGQGGAHGALSPDTVRVVSGHAWVVNPWWLEGATDVPEGDVPPMRTAWLAPEQLAGEGEEGPDTDVYGLGLILGYMVARGLTEPGHSLLVQGFDISPSLDEIYVRATARQRAARYPSVALLREAIEHALGFEWREAQWSHPVNPAELNPELPDIDLDAIDPVARGDSGEATVNEWLPPEQDIANTMEDEALPATVGPPTPVSAARPVIRVPKPFAAAPPAPPAPAVPVVRGDEPDDAGFFSPTTDVGPPPVLPEAELSALAEALAAPRAPTPTLPMGSVGAHVAEWQASPAAGPSPYGSSLESLDPGPQPAPPQGPPPIPTSERARPDMPPPIPTSERARPEVAATPLPGALPPLPTTPIPGRPGGSDLRAIPSFEPVAGAGDGLLDGREATITEAIAPSLLAHDVFGVAGDTPGPVVPPQLVDDAPRALFEAPAATDVAPTAAASISSEPGFGPPPATGPAASPAVYSADPLGPGPARARGLTGKSGRPSSRAARRPGLAISADSGLLPPHKEGRIGVAPPPSKGPSRALKIGLGAAGVVAVIVLCIVIFSKPGSDPRLATATQVAVATEPRVDAGGGVDAQAGADSSAALATATPTIEPTQVAAVDVEGAAGDAVAEADAAGALDAGPEVVADVASDAVSETVSDGGASDAAETALAAADSASEVAADAAPSGSFVAKNPDQMTCPSGMSKLKKKIKVKLADGTEADDWDVVCIDRFEFPGAGAMPLVNVDLGGARGACAARGKRLCTHSEWRRACGGTYPYGSTFNPDACRVTGPDGAPASLGAAGSKSGCRSPSGAADMVGNAAEWTSDGYVNGGSFKNGDDATCNSMSRRAGGAPHIGFRCCVDATESK